MLAIAYTNTNIMIRHIVGKESESLNLDRLVNAHEQCRENNADANNV